VSLRARKRRRRIRAIALEVKRLGPCDRLLEHMRYAAHSAHGLKLELEHMGLHRGARSDGCHLEDSLDDATLNRRAAIIEMLYRDGIQRLQDLASECDVQTEELVEDITMLESDGTLLVTEGPIYGLSDSALAAMEHGSRTAAECLVVGEEHLGLRDARAVSRAADVFGHLSYQLYQFARSAHRAAGSWIAAIESQPAMVDAMRAAYDAGEAKKRRLPDGWPHITLADCVAWAEAIVKACEAERLTGDKVYSEALYLARAIVARSDRRGRMSLDALRTFALLEAHAGQLRLARAYSAIIAVRMLAAEAEKREL
jgi:hypothetical protein